MGPAVETFLTVVLAIAAFVAIFLFLLRPIWPRVARFFAAWQRRDDELEAEEATHTRMQEAARQEVQSWTAGPDDPEEEAHEKNQA